MTIVVGNGCFFNAICAKDYMLYTCNLYKCNCSQVSPYLTVKRKKENTSFSVSHRLAEDSVASLDNVCRSLANSESHCPLQDHESHGVSGLPHSLAHTVPESDHQGKQLFLPGGGRGGGEGGRRDWRKRREEKLSYSAVFSSVNKHCCVLFRLSERLKRRQFSLRFV